MLVEYSCICGWKLRNSGGNAFSLFVCAAIRAAAQIARGRGADSAGVKLHLRAKTWRGLVSVRSLLYASCRELHGSTPQNRGYSRQAFLAAVFQSSKRRQQLLHCT